MRMTTILAALGLLLIMAAILPSVAGKEAGNQRNDLRRLRSDGAVRTGGRERCKSG